MKRNALLDRVTAIRDAKPLDWAPPPKRVPKDVADARIAERKTSYKFATLKLRNNMRVDCVILNYSSTGAKVKLRSHFTLPPTTRIIIPEMGINRNADVVWQSGDEAGLHFDVNSN